MKTSFKKVTFAVLSAAVLVAPGLASAQTDININAGGSVRSDLKNANGVTNFCTNLTTAAASVQTALTEKETKLITNQNNLTTKLTNKEADRDKKSQDKRTESDSHREQNFAKLSVKATTDAQKQAVATFEATVNAAVTARRTAIDAALAKFRTDLAALIKTRQTAVDAAAATFKTSVTAAITKAQTACTKSDADPKAIRTQLILDLKAARDAFKSNRKAQNSLKPQIQALEKTKNAAIKKAVEDFKTTVSKARATLKASLQASASTSTTVKHQEND